MAKARDWRGRELTEKSFGATALTNVEVLGTARALLRIGNLLPKVSPHAGTGYLLAR